MDTHDPRDRAILIKLTEAELALIRRNGLNPARCVIAAVLYYEQVQKRITRGNASREDQCWMRDVGQTLSRRREKIPRKLDSIAGPPDCVSTASATNAKKEPHGKTLPRR